MLLREVDNLLRPGFLPMETGYYCLPNGQWYIAVLTLMPGVKGKWVDLWFKNYILALDPLKIKCSNMMVSDSNQTDDLSFSIKANPYGKHLELGKLMNYHFFNFVYDDPSQYFNIAKLKISKVSSLVCLKSVLPDGTLDANIVHIVRDTDYGCEMRSRFWTYHDSEETARMRMELYTIDMCEVAQQLKMWVEERESTQISCKFCHSNQVVKNGIKKGNQYWLCKNCKRSFQDTRALVGMKYPSHIVIKSVQSYLAGKSLSTICRNIEKDYNILPSKSTVLGWVNKLTKGNSEKYGSPI